MDPQELEQLAQQYGVTVPELLAMQQTAAVAPETPEITVAPAAREPTLLGLQEMYDTYEDRPTTYSKEIDEARKTSADQQKRLEDAVRASYGRGDRGPSRSELFFNLSQAFLDPGKTGNFTEGLGRAAGVGADYRKQQRVAQAAQTDKQQALEIELAKQRLGLQKEDLTTLRTLDASVRGDRREVMKAALKEYIESGKPQTDGEKYARALGLQKGTAEYNEFLKDYIKKDLAGKAAHFGGLVSAVDLQGNPMFIQSTPGGGAQAIPGFRPAPYDAELLAEIARRKAGATAGGKAAGEAEAQLADLEASMPQLETTVKLLSSLGKDATHTLVGRGVDAARRELDMEPREAATARVEYMNTVKNVLLPQLSTTFPGAISNAERESLLTMLGNENLSSGEKDAALRAFITQKRMTIASQRRRVDAEPATNTPATERKFTIKRRDPAGAK